jgi:RNA polymerase sigma-70 factor (ECF subfamily)
MNHFEKKFEKITNRNFQQFYKEQKPKLTWYLSKWTKDLSTAEDIADEAFIKALISIDGYNGKMAQIHTWLYTIAVNFVKKEYQDKQKMLLISIDKEFANNASINMFIPYNDGLIEKSKQQEIYKKAEIIKEAIYTMSEKHNKYKKVLIMREIENLSYNEISDYLDLNLSTVKSQIKQGRALIAKKISKKLEYIDNHGIK